LPGQPAVEIFARSKTEFFLKVVDAQLRFELDAQGRAQALTLYQKGKQIRAPRVDEQTARLAQEALATKVSSQTPFPGSEAAVRRIYSGMLSGKPHYDDMQPNMVQATREQLPHLMAGAQRLGGIQSVEFRGVDPQGMDTYDVRHEHGRTRFRIALTSDGKIEGALMSPGP